MTSIEKSTRTKYVYFNVLHTCTKLQQSRGNDRKLVAGINFYLRNHKIIILT